MSLYLSPNEIIETISEVLSVPKREMVSDKRLSRQTRARQVAMYILREDKHLQYTEIGRLFRRDHSTVMHACKTVDEDMSIEPHYQREIEMIRSVLRGKSSRKLVSDFEQFPCGMFNVVISAARPTYDAPGVSDHGVSVLAGTKARA